MTLFVSTFLMVNVKIIIVKKFFLLFGLLSFFLFNSAHSSDFFDTLNDTPVSLMTWGLEQIKKRLDNKSKTHNFNLRFENETILPIVKKNNLTKKYDPYMLLDFQNNTEFFIHDLDQDVFYLSQKSKIVIFISVGGQIRNYGKSEIVLKDIEEIEEYINFENLCKNIRKRYQSDLYVRGSNKLDRKKRFFNHFFTNSGFIFKDNIISDENIQLAILFSLDFNNQEQKSIFCMGDIGNLEPLYKSYDLYLTNRGYIAEEVIEAQNEIDEMVGYY